MTFAWQQIRLEGFAAFQRLMRLKIHRVGSSYWTEPRPCFFRPMVLWRPLDTLGPNLPPKAVFGGFQIPVTDARAANSHFNCFVYDEVTSYTGATLDKNPRRQLKIAQSHFEIRQIRDLDEFKKEAHRVYLSFQSRTDYRTGLHRREPAEFGAWAEGLFSLPEVLILGGYRNGKLGGVALSLLLGDTMYYASVFCDDESLKLSLYDLFWHTLRESAAADSRIRLLFMGTYIGNPGLDNFKSLRGAKLVRQPALLKINPVARAIVRAALPRQYLRLSGYMSPEQIAKYGAREGVFTPESPGPAVNYIDHKLAET